MDQSLSQDFPVYNSSYGSHSNRLNTQTPNCNMPETVYMALQQLQTPSQAASPSQQHLNHQSQQHYQQHNHPQMQQQQQQAHHQSQQQTNQCHFTPHNQHVHHEPHGLQQQQHSPPQLQQQQQHFQQQNHQQQMQMNHQYGHHQSQQNQSYQVPSMSSAYNSYSNSSGHNSSAMSYSCLPDGASLLNPTHVMFQPKPEPPTYPTMTGNHLTFAQLAAIGHSQDGSGFSGDPQVARSNHANATIVGSFNSNNYTSSPYTQSYRDSYESGSPESANGSSPPGGLIKSDSAEGSLKFGMYSSSPNISPPRSSYGYGTPQESFASPSTGVAMVSDPYVYAPTDCPPYSIPQIKTETASPCSTPTPHQISHIETHPYARPSPGSSPRACRRMPIEQNSSQMGSSPKSGGIQPGSPNSSRRAHVLPPCKVCGVQATGFHYGVNTCEACKGFFRRSIIRKEEYTCLKSSKCIIEPAKRNLCGYCRYHKCLEAGMSVEGIKTGRYTYQKRTKDILELQQLKKEQSEVRNQETKRMKERQTNDLIVMVLEVMERHPDFVHHRETMLMQKKYLEEKQMLTDLFGKMERVNSEDYVYALENLGLELDDRREISNQLIEEMNMRMPLMYAILRELPEIDTINNNDTTSLFKFSYFDIWLIARSKMFTLSEGVFTTPRGVSFDFATVFGQDAAETVQRLAAKVNTYSYTNEERILLVGVVFLCTDRVFLQLEDRDTIDKIRETYIEALEIHLPGNHPDVDHIFAKTLQIIADLRTVTQALYNGLKGLLKYTNARKYPLVNDILTVR